MQDKDCNNSNSSSSSSDCNNIEVLKQREKVGVGVGEGIKEGGSSPNYAPYQLPNCSICDTECRGEKQEVNALVCSNERCGTNLYHQECLENHLKLQRVNKNRKSGFKCPRACVGRIIKSHPFVKDEGSRSGDDVVVVSIQSQRQRGEEGVVVVSQRGRGGEQQGQAQAGPNDKDRVITMKTSSRVRGQIGKNEVVGTRKWSNLNVMSVVKGCKIEAGGQLRNGMLQGQQAVRGSETGSRRSSDSSPQSKKHDHIILVENAWTSRSHFSSSLADRNPQQLPPLNSEEAFPPPTAARSASEYSKIPTQPRSQSYTQKQAYQSVWPLPSSQSTSGPLPALNGSRQKANQPTKQLLRRPQPPPQQQVQQTHSKAVETPFKNSVQSPKFDEPFAEFVTHKPVAKPMLQEQNPSLFQHQMRAPVRAQRITADAQYAGKVGIQHQDMNSTYFSSLPRLVVPQMAPALQYQQQPPTHSYPFSECIDIIKIRKLQAALKALMNIGYDLYTARAAVQHFGQDLQSSLAWLQGGCQPVQILEEPQICVDWEVSRLHELVQQGASVNQIVEAVKQTNGDVVLTSEMLFPQIYQQGQGQMSPPLSPIQGPLPSYPPSSPSVEVASQNAYDQISDLNLESDDKAQYFRALGSFCYSDTSFKSPLDVNPSITSDDSFSEATHGISKSSRFMSFFRLQKVTSESSQSCEQSSQNSQQHHQESDYHFNDDNFSSEDHIHYILDSLDDNNVEHEHAKNNAQKSTQNQAYDYGLPDSLYDDNEISNSQGGEDAINTQMPFMVMQ